MFVLYIMIIRIVPQDSSASSVSTGLELWFWSRFSVTAVLDTKAVQTLQRASLNLLPMTLISIFVSAALYCRVFLERHVRASDLVSPHLSAHSHKSKSSPSPSPSLRSHDPAAHGQFALLGVDQHPCIYAIEAGTIHASPWSLRQALYTS
jgi:hypothetical protein